MHFDLYRAHPSPVRSSAAPFIYGDQMNIDEDKIDEYTLALLYLVAHERRDGAGARAWKGFDCDT